MVLLHHLMGDNLFCELYAKKQLFPDQMSAKVGHKVETSANLKTRSSIQFIHYQNVDKNKLIELLAITLKCQI